MALVAPLRSWILSILNVRHLKNPLKGTDLDLFVVWCFLGYSIWAALTISNASLLWDKPSICPLWRGRGNTWLQRLVKGLGICLIRMQTEVFRIKGLTESNLATKGPTFVKLISRNSMPNFLKPQHYEIFKS